MVENAPTEAGGDVPMCGDDYYRRQLHREHWFRNNRQKHEMRWQAILRIVDPQAHDVVLNLGCAVGAHTTRIAPLVGHAAGIDYSPIATRLARSRAEHRRPGICRGRCDDA